MISDILTLYNSGNIETHLTRESIVFNMLSAHIESLHGYSLYLDYAEKIRSGEAKLMHHYRDKITSARSSFNTRRDNCNEIIETLEYVAGCLDIHLVMLKSNLERAWEAEFIKHAPGEMRNSNRHLRQLVFSKE